MGVQAIDKKKFPQYWERPKCSIASNRTLWSFPVPLEKYFDLLPALPLNNCIISVRDKLQILVYLDYLPLYISVRDKLQILVYLDYLHLYISVRDRLQILAYLDYLPLYISVRDKLQILVYLDDLPLYISFGDKLQILVYLDYFHGIKN